MFNMFSATSLLALAPRKTMQHSSALKTLTRAQIELTQLVKKANMEYQLEGNKLPDKCLLQPLVFRDFSIRVVLRQKPSFQED